MVSSQREYVDNKYTMLIIITETQAPGSSAILASTAASERGFLLIQKHSNLKIFLFDWDWKGDRGKRKHLEREWLQNHFSLPGLIPPEVWAILQGLGQRPMIGYSGHNEDLVNTHHSPARSLREEEGGRGAHDGAQAEYEEREDRGVASLDMNNIKCVKNISLTQWSD